MVQPSSKIFLTPNSFSILHLPSKTSYPATTRRYLISSTFMPHSLPNSLLTPTTSGSLHTSKPLKHFVGTSRRSTSATSTPCTSRAEALTNLKSATHRYHKLVIAAKQKYYSSLIHSSSSNPRHLWRAVNSLLHRKSPSPLPTSIPSPSIADTFCSFFSDKISSLRFTLQSLLASQPSAAASPPTSIPLPLPPR